MIPPIGEADLVERGHARLVTRRLVLAAIEERQLDIFERAGAGEEIEALEDETEIAAAEQRPLVPIEPFDMETLEQELPGGRDVRAEESRVGKEGVRTGRSRGS